jgi:outer membrane protein
MMKAAAAILAVMIGASLLPAHAADPVSAETFEKSPIEPVSMFDGFYLHVGPGMLDLNEGADIRVGGALQAGASIDIDPHFSAIVEAGYFFTPNFAVSFTGGLPPKIDIMGAGAAAPLGRLGTMTYGPSTLTAHYHFTNFGRFQPYIGAGPTFMLAFDTKDGALANLKVDHAIGFAVQIGADFMINENWGAFVDFKKAYLRTKATGTLGGAPVTSDVRLDPAVYHVGITYRF